MKEKKAKRHVRETSTIDEETYGYFKRVEDVMDEDDFDNEESRALFVSNVFLQLQNNELTLFCDQTISRTMEKLVVFLNDVQIRTVMQNTEEHFSQIVKDKFGSHVVQTIICTIPRVIRLELQRVRQENNDLKSAEGLFLNLCVFLKENLNELVDHVYGSHVVRSTLEVLSGVKVANNVVRSRASRLSREKIHHSEKKKNFMKLTQVGNAFGSSAIKPMETMAVPESFPPMLKQLTKMILKMELARLALHPISNPVIQTLLLVLHKKEPSLCMKLCKAVMSQIHMQSNKREASGRKTNKSDNDDKKLYGNDDNNDDDDIKKKEQCYRVPVILSNEISSHLVEKIFHVVSPDIWQEIYDSYFRMHLAQLAQHPIANYTVQHLMASTHDKSQAKQVISELLPYMEGILALGHMGVVVRIAELAIRFSVKQKKVVKEILRSFHCEGRDQQTVSIVLISSLTTYDVFFGTNQKDDEQQKNSEKQDISTPKLKFINFHGALLLKTLFEFQDPGILVESLLSLSLEELITLATDQMGSYATEAFLKSVAVPFEKKHKLIEKLEGSFSKLASEKQGSHVVETCWRQADVKHKEAINRELAHSEQQLNGNFYGRIVLRNCGVEHFKRKDKSWHEREEQASKKRKMLEEIFEDREESKHPKKVQNKGTEKFAKFGPEMAALGFTTAGQHATGDDIEDDRDLISFSNDDTTDVLWKNKKKKIFKKENGYSDKRTTKETLELDSHGDHKTNKKSRKQKKK